MDRRRIAIIASIMLMAGVGVCGCDEGGGNSGGNGNNPGGDIRKVDASCTDPDVCETASNCQDETSKLACQCVTDTETCHNNAECNGVGTCSYICSPAANTCGYQACQETKACRESCVAELLPEFEDFDEDGIKNGREITCGYDPCNPDKDGDGIIDGLEDLNQDCEIQRDYGETDPTNPDDPGGSNSESRKVEFSARQVVCNQEKMNGQSESPSGFQFVYALPPKDNSELEFVSVGTNTNSSGQVVTFDARNSSNANDIVGLHQLLNFNLSGNLFLKTPLDSVNVQFIQESKFESEVPASTWSPNIYKPALQIVSNHRVDRYKYRLTVGDVSLESIRSAIVGDSTLGGTTNTVCSSGKAMLYMAHTYDWAEGSGNANIYSIGISCQETLSETGNVANQWMDDIISGTMITAGRYKLDKTFICQSEKYASSSGSVDFIWVLDNSGSMSDELDHVAETTQRFVERLGGAEFDFRLMVTATDAYTLEEWPATAKPVNGSGGAGGYLPVASMDGDYFSTKSNSEVYTINGYYEPTGLINTDGNGGDFSGLLKSRCALEKEDVVNTNGRHFQAKVSQFKSCRLDKYLGKNVCGYGLEDGLKSGLVVLERMAAGDTDETKKEDELGNDIYSLKQKFVCPTTDSSCTKVDKCMLRTEALKYFIFVTDEESRQFKEAQEISSATQTTTTYANTTASPTTASGLNTCSTGFKLEKDAETGALTMNRHKYELPESLVGKMNLSTEDLALLDAQAKEICNPELKTAELSNMGDDSIKEEDSLMDIQAKNSDYYDLLMYYMQEYRKFAGTGGVAAFALVGDSYENGGRCGKLTQCQGKCIINNQIDTTTGGLGCQLCKVEGTGKDYASWDDAPVKDTASAVIGANYGLSYIHFARFLSTLTEDGSNNGKAGGYGSICNETFAGTVEEIFKDVQGRLSAHPLKGYPVSSSIHVSITKSNGKKVIELKRGADTDGWDYDASQNAVVFNGINDVEEGDFIAIAYNIWEKQGA